MKQVSLRATPIVTSALGFGCGTLTTHSDRGKAIAMLEEAFVLGITHFDVARLYGFGQAEGILGQFLQGKRDKVTVTTKFGMQFSGGLANQRWLVNLGRRLAHRFNFIRSLARRTTKGMMQQGAFSPQDAANSLEISLRELNTDYVDILELHEATPADSRREDLIAYLEGEVKKGRVRAIGLGTQFAKLQGDAKLTPPQYTVLQFDSDTCHGNLENFTNSVNRALITFGSISRAKELASVAKVNTALFAKWHNQVGVDLRDASVVTGLLLHHAAGVNPHGITLFATTRSQNLQSNVRLFNAPVAGDLSAFQAFAREAISAQPCVTGKS